MFADPHSGTAPAQPRGVIIVEQHGVILARIDVDDLHDRAITTGTITVSLKQAAGTGGSPSDRFRAWLNGESIARTIAQTVNHFPSFTLIDPIDERYRWHALLVFSRPLAERRVRLATEAQMRRRRSAARSCAKDVARRKRRKFLQALAARSLAA